jgi:hypothetical protein
MSKLFYDHLTKLKKVEKEIKKVSVTEEERHELWGIVDEIIHHRILGCIFDHLPEKHHKSFLERFREFPHDLKILDFLTEKIKEDVPMLIRYEAKKIEHELLEQFLDKKELKKGKSKNKTHE